MNGLADSPDGFGTLKVYEVTDEGCEAVRDYHEWMRACEDEKPYNDSKNNIFDSRTRALFSIFQV